MGALPSGTVTFLFTDIEGSTRLLEGLGEQYGSVQAEHHRLIRDAVDSHDGFVINTMGDGVFAAFGSASTAVAAAVDAQRALGSFEWPAAAAIKVRMGLHSGEATPHGGEYVSLAVHHAARVGNAGHGGQIVVSESTRALVHTTDEFSFRDLGPHRLKDLGGAVRLHQVCHPELDGSFPPLRSLDQAAHNLPVQLTSFIGRSDELVQLTRLLSDDRLVTLTGAGGAGKTRLALHVAADVVDAFDGGAWLVELAPIVEPDAVIFAVADAMQVRAEPGRTPRELVLARLSGAPTLVLLDNCEHVLHAAGDFAAAVLGACPDAKIVATSREPLGVPGETVWRVPSMATTDDSGDVLASDAVQLFLDRARHVRPDWRSPNESERDAVREICERLDGIPLAIELAAARLDALGVEQIRTRLHDRFRLLTGGSRVTLERQRTLRAAVDWSHALLDDGSKVLLRRLAVFSGGFTLEAAEAVCTGAGLPADDVLDLLADLVRKSLVVDDTNQSPRRYRLLETIRQYAREALMDAGEAETVQAAQYEWVVGLFASTWLAADFVGLDWFAEVAAIDAEFDNIVAALTWAADADDPARLDALVQRCADRWRTVGHINALRHWTDVALNHPGHRLNGTLGRLLVRQSVNLRDLGDLAGARTTFDRGVSLFENDLEPAVRHWLSRVEAILLSDEGDYEAQLKLERKALALAAQSGRGTDEVTSLINQSQALESLGDFDGATALRNRARDKAREANVPLGEAYSAVALVRLMYNRGDVAGALALLDEVRELVRRVGDANLSGMLLSFRFALTWRRDLPAAIAALEEHLAFARRMGLSAQEFQLLGNLGGMAFIRGDLATAARLSDAAHRRWRPTAPPDAPTKGFDSFSLMCRGDLDGAAAIEERDYRPDRESVTTIGIYLGVVRHDPSALRCWLQRADEQSALRGRTDRTPSDEIVWALLAAFENDLDPARAAIRRAIRADIETGYFMNALDALDALAHVAVIEGHVTAAGACLGLTAVVREDREMRRSLLGIDTWTDDTRAAAEAIDAEAFAAGRERGEAAGVEGFFALAAELAGTD